MSTIAAVPKAAFKYDCHCPGCGGNTLRKLSVVVAQGTRNGTSTRVGVGGIRHIGAIGGLSFGSSHSESGIASKYARPAAPSYANNGYLVSGWMVFMSSVVLSIVDACFAGWAGCLFGGLGLLWSARLFSKAKALNKVQMAGHAEQAETYARTFVCTKCETLVDMGTGEFVSM
jgi:hypothetical protein